MEAEQEFSPGRPRFRRRLFGYEPSQVDAHINKTFAAYTSARADAERMGGFDKIGPHVATLIASFAENVRSILQKAEDEAAEVRAEAENYASERRASADELFESGRESALTTATAIAERASGALANLARQRQSAQVHLTDAATNVTSALVALGALDALPQSVTIDLSKHAQSTAEIFPPDAQIAVEADVTNAEQFHKV